MKFGPLGLLGALLSAGAYAAPPSTQRASLPMVAPEGVQNAILIGELAPTTHLHLSIALKWGDSQGVQRFVDSVSDPAGPTYRHFITPDEVGRRFGLPAATVSRVTAFLQAQGITVRKVSRSRLLIRADATVAQAQAAFGISISSYLQPESFLRAEHPLYAFNAAPTVPADLAPYIVHIDGLENFDPPAAQQFISPSQLETLYGLATTYGGGYQGQGRTVAITSFDGFELSNVPLLYAHFGFPTPSGGVGKNITVKVVDPGSAGENGPRKGEGDTDIECALSMAPLCNLIIYDGGSTSNSDTDPLGALSAESDDDTADIVTESYLFKKSASFYASAHALHLAMSAQGITYMNAAGDHGAPGIADFPYPDDDPEVLVVGGTTATTDPAGDRDTETAWNYAYRSSDAEYWGGGGGWVKSADAFNTLPSYQKGTGVPTNIP